MYPIVIVWIPLDDPLCESEILNKPLEVVLISICMLIMPSLYDHSVRDSEMISLATTSKVLQVLLNQCTECCMQRHVQMKTYFPNDKSCSLT